jgi:hypothetical protein
MEQEPIRASVRGNVVTFEGDGRTKLGLHLQEIVNASQRAKSGLLDRWKKNQAYYDNQPEASNLPYVDAPLIHHPLTQPKIDYLSATLTTTILNQSPVFLFSYGNSHEAAKRAEKQLDFFLDQEFESSIDDVSVCAAIRNHGFLKVTFEAAAQSFLPLAKVRALSTGPLSSAGLKFDFVPAEDMDIFPDNAHSVQAAQYVGHRFWRQVREIKQLQRAKRYDEVEIKVTGHPSEKESARDFGFGRTDQATTGQEDEALVQLAEGIFKWDFNGRGDRRYIATFLVETGEILKIRPYNMSRPWYVDFRLKTKAPDCYWSATSVGQDLQGLQWQYNIQHNTVAYGTLMKAFQPILGEGPASKVQKVSPGSVVMVPGKVVGGLQSTYDPGGSTLIIQQIERQADAVTGVTQEATGSSISKRQTKYETQVRQTGASTKLEKFLQTFNIGMVEVAHLCVEHLWRNYELWSLAYPGCIHASQQELMLPFEIRVQGSTPDANPQLLLEKLMVLRQMAVEDMTFAQGQPDPITGQSVPPIDPTTGMPIVPPLNLFKLTRLTANKMRIENIDEVMNPEGGMVGNGSAPPMGQPMGAPGVQEAL